MIQWMKAYNQDKENKVLFMGIDMQIPWGVLHNLEESAKKSLDLQLEGWVQKLISSQRSLEESAKKHQSLKRSILHLARLIEKRILNSDSSPFIKRKAQALRQFAQMQQVRGKTAFTIRDKAMTENVEAILYYHQGTKIMLWAHNGHVQKTGGWFKPVGYYLAQKYGPEYVSIGFATGKGTFSAWNETGVFSGNNSLANPLDNSFESWFNKAREKNFLLNLEADSLREQACKWLYTKKMFRSIGWKAPQKPEHQFAPLQSLPDHFDAVIYLDRTTSTDAYVGK